MIILTKTARREALIKDFPEYAKYLPKDAPVPADATHVLSLRSTKVDSTDQAPKVEVALKARSATIEMLANLGLDLL